MMVNDRYKILRDESVKLGQQLLSNLMKINSYISDEESRHHDLFEGYMDDPEIRGFRNELDELKGSISPQLLTQLKRWTKKHRGKEGG